MKLVPFSLIAFATLLGACGLQGLPPTDRLASSESAARSARELGAAQTPQASLHLKLANEEIEQARGLMHDGENRRADLVLQRASADAELALELTKETALRAQADQAMQVVQKAKTASPLPATPSGKQ